MRLSFFHDRRGNVPSKLKPVQCCLYRRHATGDITLLNVSPSRAKQINDAIENGQDLFTDIEGHGFLVEVFGAEPYDLPAKPQAGKTKAPAMFEITPQQAARDVLNAPLVEWSKLVTALPSADRREMEEFLTRTIVQATRLIGYLEARGTTGCGDGGHAEGVKNSNRLVAKVRKALGFTYTRADINF